MTTYSDLTINQKINQKQSLVNKAAYMGQNVTTSQVVARVVSDRFESICDHLYNAVRVYN